MGKVVAKLRSFKMPSEVIKVQEGATEIHFTSEAARLLGETSRSTTPEPMALSSISGV